MLRSHELELILLSAASAGPVLSVFSGAGGLDLGLDRAGFSTVACLDTEPAAQGTLRANEPGWEVPEDGDVSTAAARFTPRSLGMEPGDLAILAGGPPCQPFSKAAQWHLESRRGMNDPRAEPVNGMLDLLESFQPAVLLIENVAGYLSGRGSARPVIEERLRSINEAKGTAYRLMWEVLDAADFGVPQHRKRAIAVAFRDGSRFEFPVKTHSEHPVRAWDVLFDAPRDGSMPTPSGSWTPLLPSIPEGGNYQWLTARGGGPELFGWRTRYWSFLLKLARDRPSWTLPASPGPNTGPFHWENRPLSVRERLRLQSFPDGWELTGGVREQMVLAGNATPPLLAEVIGLKIASHIGVAGADARRPSLLRQRQETVPAPARPSPIPDRFVPLIGKRSAHPGAGMGPAYQRRGGSGSSAA